MGGNWRRIQGQERDFLFKGGIPVACLNDDENDPIVKEKSIQEKEAKLIEEKF